MRLMSVQGFQMRMILVYSITHSVAVRSEAAMSALPVSLQSVDAAPECATTLRRMRLAMGTSLVMEASAPTAARAQAALLAAFAAVDQVARLLHPTQPGSDLARLAACVPGGAVPLARPTFVLLRFAQRLHHLSSGIFDPCLPERPARLCDLELIDGAPAHARVHAPLAIDCGGIAKGFAVDVAIMTLRRHGCRAALVNAGGDLRLFGAHPQPLWLRGPDGLACALRLSGGAVAVSEWQARRAPSQHRGYYLRSGARAAGAPDYAAVRARRAMHADALTKCVLLAPPAAADALLATFGAQRLA
jgi:FAD:protein FMN transferase